MLCIQCKIIEITANKNDISLHYLTDDISNFQLVCNMSCKD